MTLLFFLRQMIDRSITQHSFTIPYPNLFKIGLVLASSMAIATGCGSSSNSSSLESSPTVSASPVSPTATEVEPSPEVSPPTPTAADSTLISATGIGPAQLGMTLGDLKQILGAETEFTVESPFIVDFDAIAVRQGEETLFYILSLPGTPPTDADPIEGLYTDNPKFRTEADVGPGTSLQAATQAYGPVTLSYNTQNESREYARFARQPSTNISFATGNGNQDAAGVYASPTQEYNETSEFRDDATIQSVLVVCLTEGCTPPTN